MPLTVLYFTGWCRSGSTVLGNVLAAVAIPWFVLTETGSALQTGLAALFASAPLAIESCQ